MQTLVVSSSTILFLLRAVEGSLFNCRIHSKRLSLQDSTNRKLQVVNEYVDFFAKWLILPRCIAALVDHWTSELIGPYSSPFP